MQFDFTGKRVLITGSSRGIGRSLAGAFASAGATIILHGVSDSKTLLTAKKELQDQGADIEHISADLTNLRAVREMGATLVERGGVDILVLNASLQIKCAWSEINDKDMVDQMSANLFASTLLCQSLVPQMQERHWGRIITIGSVQQQRPHPDMLIYAASKSAQENMTRNLAQQISGDGVTVNNVAPGVILTDRNIEALADPEYSDKVKENIPVGFFGEPHDCSGAVLLLASEEGRYITGVDIPVDGGLGLP